LKNGIKAILNFIPRPSSSSGNLNIFVEKVGHASCIVTMANFFFN
jgi:hypothetical protein